MKWFGPRFIIVLLAGLAASGSLWAHNGHMGHGGHMGHMGHGGHWGHMHHVHGHVGVSIGVPLGWYYPGYYAYPYPYSSPYTYYSYPPPAYVEQNPGLSATTQQPDYWWYYCPSTGYYPYIKECSQGWQRVAPQPPDLR